MRGTLWPPIRLGIAHDIGAGETGDNPAWITDGKSARHTRRHRERETMWLLYKTRELLPYLWQGHTHLFARSTLEGSGKWVSQVCNEWDKETTQFGSITHVIRSGELHFADSIRRIVHEGRSDLVLSRGDTPRSGFRDELVKYRGRNRRGAH